MNTIHQAGRMTRHTTLAAAITTLLALGVAGCSSIGSQGDGAQGPAPITEARPSTSNAQTSGVNPGGAAASAVKPVVVGGGAGGGANGAGAGVDAGNGRTVYFDYDKSTVKEEYRGVVEANARRLAGNRSQKVMIEGHTDERGGHEYNLALGQRRAESVQAAMKLLGASDSQMESVSFGKERPAVQGSNEAAWSKNRRAEIKDR